MAYILSRRKMKLQYSILLDISNHNLTKNSYRITYSINKPCCLKKRCYCYIE